MARYQAGDFAAATAIDCIGPQSHRFRTEQFAGRSDADDLLQETWLRIHRVRHTYRSGEPALPWFLRDRAKVHRAYSKLRDFGGITISPERCAISRPSL